MDGWSFGGGSVRDLKKSREGSLSTKLVATYVCLHTELSNCYG